MDLQAVGHREATDLQAGADTARPAAVDTGRRGAEGTGRQEEAFLPAEVGRRGMGRREAPRGVPIRRPATVALRAEATARLAGSDRRGVP